MHGRLQEKTMVGDPNFSSDKSLSLSIIHVLLKKKKEKSVLWKFGCFSIFCPRPIKSGDYFGFTAFGNVHRKG